MQWDYGRGYHCLQAQSHPFSRFLHQSSPCSLFLKFLILACVFTLALPVSGTNMPIVFSPVSIIHHLSPATTSVVCEMRERVRELTEGVKSSSSLIGNWKESRRGREGIVAAAWLHSASPTAAVDLM